MTTLLLLALLGGWKFEPGPVEEPKAPQIEMPIAEVAKLDVPKTDSDGRPVVIMYTLETAADFEAQILKKQKVNCPPCLRAYRWSKEADCPVRLEIRKPPEDARGFPDFTWQQNDGVWKRPAQPGFSDMTRLTIIMAAPRMMLPQPKAAGVAASPQTILDTLKRFGGDSGSFVFQPDQPQAPNFDGTTLRYPSISGRYSLSGVPTVKLNQPTPGFSTSAYGAKFSGVLDPTITYDAGTSSIAVTGRSGWLSKTVKIKVEGGE